MIVINVRIQIVFGLYLAYYKVKFVIQAAAHVLSKKILYFVPPAPQSLILATSHFKIVSHMGNVL
jgi:hypothetical protein